METWLSLWSIGQFGTIKEFNEIKAGGFDGVEIWAEQLKSKEYLEYAHQSDLKVGVHLPFHDLNLATPDHAVAERSIHVLSEWLETMAKYGAKHATFHGGYAWSSEERDESILRAGEKISSLKKVADENGMELLLENLIPDRLNYCHHIASNTEEWLHLVKSLNIKACLDIGHLAMMKTSWEEAITRLGDSLGAVHLSDNDAKSDLHLLPGEGNDLSRGLFEYLQSKSYSGPVVYEINPYKYSLTDIIAHVSKVKEKA
ncbi:sugar phosphate isomerase/epimerase family protein [Priestia koreensis]|uniref:sugar phosphate isomerase/epimerase family protein n=1 Tax=Priestia koreensis TaxID=284581 RepID=UPI001F589FA0|nr:sugar phosphate isomerase/epimerase family protein [Priestia koreensis]UNL85281.1 sugar phosphate isomerase/epimerase [Priestia koreensis]